MNRMPCHHNALTLHVAWCVAGWPTPDCRQCCSCRNSRVKHVPHAVNDKAEAGERARVPATQHVASKHMVTRSLLR
jgi:hypothetical protein